MIVGRFINIPLAILVIISIPFSNIPGRPFVIAVPIADIIFPSVPRISTDATSKPLFS